MFGNHRFRDDKPGGHGTVNLYDSIVHSCDTYYYILANDLGVDRIHDYMEQWKFGGITGIDILGESTGILPSTKWKKRVYHQKWIAGETISIGIGQGYNSFTPLQMAHAMATLANNGVIMKPHLVKAIENYRTNAKKLVVSEPAGRVNAKQSDIDIVKNALVGVNISGTSSGVFAGTPYQVAGKTGTAQVITIKQNERYVASRINERHRDHSWYVAFAPADNPKIALAVVVENGGFGAASAAPLARQALDFYLLGKRPAVAMAPKSIVPDVSKNNENHENNIH
jgi:penicillin-binding protein 2